MTTPKKPKKRPVKGKTKTTKSSKPNGLYHPEHGEPLFIQPAQEVEKVSVIVDIHEPIYAPTRFEKIREWFRRIFRI